MYFITTHTAQNFFLKLQSKDGLQKNPKKQKMFWIYLNIKLKLKLYVIRKLIYYMNCLKILNIRVKKHDLETPIIEHASSLKRFLVQEYSTTLHSSHPENIFLFILSISTHAHLLQHFMAVIYEILTLLKHLGEC